MFVLGKLKFFFLAALFLVQLSCSINEVTGKRNLNFVSTAEEVQIGKTADLQLKKQYGVVTDIKLNAYVKAIGDRVAAFSERDDVRYYFTILDSPMINAFALPGGYVYVTRGLLSQFNSESELAFVLGHEVSHIAAKHGAQRLSQQKSIQFANVLASIFIEDNEQSKELSSLVNQGVQLAVLGYGRDNELEADLFGAKYAAEADYDPKDFDDFFYALKRQENSKNTWLDNLYASHPPTGERIEKLNEYIASENLRASVDKPETDNVYLKQLSGLYMGPGHMIGNLVSSNAQLLYENLAYQVQFFLSNEWSISKSDSPDALVTLKHRSMPIKGSLEIIRPKRQVSSLSQLATAYLRAPNKKMSHKRLSYLKVPAYQTKYRLSFSDFGNAVETATYFQNNGFYYRLVFVSKKSFSTAYDREIESLLRTVSLISPKRLHQLKAYWIVTPQIEKKETLKGIYQKFKPQMPMSINSVVLLNNISLKKEFKQGETFKLPVLYPYY
tara:strand:+ start:820 stop:2316 length:1497 start_codon:yes stop_codon:yes gene_type:complete